MKKKDLEELLETNNVWEVYNEVSDRLYINNIRYNIGNFLEMLDDVINRTVAAGNQWWHLKGLRKAKTIIQRNLSGESPNVYETVFCDDDDKAINSKPKKIEYSRFDVRIGDIVKHEGYHWFIFDTKYNNLSKILTLFVKPS